MIVFGSQEGNSIAAKIRESERIAQFIEEGEINSVDRLSELRGELEDLNSTIYELEDEKAQLETEIYKLERGIKEQALALAKAKQNPVAKGQSTLF